MFDYILRLQHSVDKIFFKEYVIRSGDQVGISSQYYSQYFLIKIKTINKEEEGKFLGDQYGYSEGIAFETLVKA